MVNVAKSETGQNNRLESAGALKYLTFHLGKELYAINIMAVREILEYEEVTSMPMMPDFICGAINLRGRAVPVIDLARRMCQGEAAYSGRACIIIVEMRYDETTLDVGVIVDAVNRVIDLKTSDIDTTPTFGGNIRTDFLTGLGKVDGQFIILLNIEKVLSMDDLRILSEVDSHIDQDDEPPG